nr:ribonuclease H-like domain-containing protein [Tanacetum cinerariifolium]
DLNTNKIIISRHVTFDETVYPFPSTKSTTIPSYDFLDDSTDLISIIIRTAPITLVLTPVHTPQVDVPTPPTPPTPLTPPSPPTPYVRRPKGANIVRCIWLFRHKFLADGNLSWYKARLVANGSTHVEDVDVDETFSPVVKPGTIWTRTYAMEILERGTPVVDTESKLGDGGTLIVDPTLYQSLAGSLYAEAEYRGVANAVAETCWI